MKRYISIALVVLTGLMLSSCGLTSGTIFISQEVDDSITSTGGGTTLDDTFGYAIVNFTDNSDWQDYDIEGIEDGCIAMDVWNHLSTAVSGEVWITLDTTVTGYTSTAQIEAAGGFRIFSGIALPAGPDTYDPDDPSTATKHFTCAETFAMLENVDQLVGAMQQGYFMAWGLANEDTFNFTWDGIVFGAHVTGSL